MIIISKRLKAPQLIALLKNNITMVKTIPQKDAFRCLAIEVQPPTRHQNTTNQTSDLTLRLDLGEFYPKER